MFPAQTPFSYYISRDKKVFRISLKKSKGSSDQWTRRHVLEADKSCFFVCYWGIIMEPKKAVQKRQANSPWKLRRLLRWTCLFRPNFYREEWVPIEKKELELELHFFKKKRSTQPVIWKYAVKIKDLDPDADLAPSISSRSSFICQESRKRDVSSWLDWSDKLEKKFKKRIRKLTSSIFPQMLFNSWPREIFIATNSAAAVSCS